VIAALRRPLHLVLWELCVLEHRARFWMRACLIELVVGVAFAATLASGLAASKTVVTVSGIVQGTLFGAILGLVVIMLVVAREARRFDRLGPPSCT
jgi:predicted membrane-bound spermidine synthase